MAVDFGPWLWKPYLFFLHPRSSCMHQFFQSTRNTFKTTSPNSWIVWAFPTWKLLEKLLLFGPNNGSYLESLIMVNPFNLFIRVWSNSTTNIQPGRHVSLFYPFKKNVIFIFLPTFFILSFIVQQSIFVCNVADKLWFWNSNQIDDSVFAVISIIFITSLIKYNYIHDRSMVWKLG